MRAEAVLLALLASVVVPAPASEAVPDPALLEFLGALVEIGGEWVGPGDLVDVPADPGALSDEVPVDQDRGDRSEPAFPAPPVGDAEEEDGR